LIKNLQLYRYIPGAVLFMIISGCTTRTLYNEKYVSDKIEQRSGFSLPVEESDSLQLPSGVTPEDGLTEEEAVAIALWNNPHLQVVLADLGFARADLIEAGMLPNPVFSLLFPIGPKQMEFTLHYAIDVLWQRPKRVAASKLNAEKVAENLVQYGLALVRDVYVSFAELNKFREQLRVLEDEAELDIEIAEIATSRLEAGDISELEETGLHLAASRSIEASLYARRDMETSKIRFLNLLGLMRNELEIQIEPTPVGLLTLSDPEQMMKTALAYRPDMRAAELEIEIAGEKLGWERSKIFNLTAMLDANAEGKEGFEMGPGVQFEIPLFYFNQGGKTRARADMERAANNYIAIQQSIRSEVMESYQGYLASSKAYEMLNNELIPSATQAVENGEMAWITGEISYLEFLEFKRQLLNARLRILEAESEVRKNIANVYYSIGGKMIAY
jgi:cobalt-zinc-cadmium efflux system outer membrane protein